MKALFDEPIYKSGSAFYQETGRSNGKIQFRWRYIDEPTNWRHDNGCSELIWLQEVIRPGVIDENAV
jgi:hypothetical protein